MTCPACACPIVPDATEEPRIDFCVRCGMGMTVPHPSRDVRADGLFEDAAAGYGGARLSQRDQWFREAARRLDWVHLQSGSAASILEIGAATGEFVAAAERCGHPTVGLETSPWAAESASDVTANVYLSDLQSWVATHPGERYDAIVMFHVLEHFAQPAEFLTSLLSVSHSATRLYVEVPNGGSLGARSQGVQWWAARPEDHFWHFSPDGARLIFESSGWAVITVRAVDIRVYGAESQVAWLTALKSMIRPILGRPRRSRDLLRVVAVPSRRVRMR